jgi:hypothetical protein
MRRIFFASVALAAVASAACRQYDVDVYRNVNGKVPQGVYSSVGQSFVCTADSLLWAEFFVGAANSGGKYSFEIRDLASNDLMYSRDTAVTGQNYEYVRADLLRFGSEPLIKGKEYVLKVTYLNPGHNDSLNFYYDPTNPYKYGGIQFPGLGYHPPPQPWEPDSDLCCRIEGVNRAVSRDLAEEPVRQPDLSVDSVWVSQGAAAQVTLHARVRNIGTWQFASAKKGCCVQFAIGGNPVSAVTEPARLNIGGVALVQSVPVSPDRSIMHLVSAEANPNKEVMELNFDNNARYCSLSAQ